LPPDAPIAFFSYSREDSEFALRLAADLRAAGASVWIDQLDIGPGQLWDRAVQSALEHCPSVLIILSPASVSSDNVMDEINFALDQKKALIPVLYRDCDVPFRLRRFQHLDFRTEYERMLEELRKWLHLGAPAVASPAEGSGAATMPASSTGKPATALVASQAPDRPPTAVPHPAALLHSLEPEGTKPKSRGKIIAISAGIVLVIIGIIVLVSRSGSDQGADQGQAAQTQSSDSSPATKSNAHEGGGSPNGPAQIMATALMHDKTENCTNPGSSDSDFSVNDPAVWLFFAYRNGSADDKWKVEWVDPDGSTYREELLQQPAAGAARYCYFIRIAGHPPAQKAGTWAARLYLNDVQKDERVFSINK